LLLAAPARAEAPLDTVYLVGGGLVRGTLAESVPNDHVTIVLITGEVRRVPWSEIVRIEAGGASPSPAPAPAPAPAPPMRGPTVTVHITSRVPVLLDRRPAGSDTWVPACASPCDAELPIGDTYRVEGAGLRASQEIHLAAQPGARVELAVTPARKALRGLGQGFATVGASFGLLGIPMLISGIAQAGRSCGPESPNSVYVTPDGSFTQCRQDVASGRDLRNAGIVLTAIALTTGGIGVWLWLRNDASGVEERPSAPPPTARVAAAPIVRLERRADEVALPLVDLRF
jgi:hypothetical protein